MEDNRILIILINVILMNFIIMVINKNSIIIDLKVILLMNGIIKDQVINIIIENNNYYCLDIEDKIIVMIIENLVIVIN